jgi:hypothetical protein
MLKVRFYSSVVIWNFNSSNISNTSTSNTKINNNNWNININNSSKKIQEKITS